MKTDSSPPKLPQFAPSQLSLPAGLEELLQGLGHAVIRDQPADIIAFAAGHFEEEVKRKKGYGFQPIRTGAVHTQCENADPAPTETPPAAAESEVDIDLEDPEVQKAAAKIQASFRGHFKFKKK